MNDKINTPIVPEELDPAPHVKIAGDWNDDDAEAYEDDFGAADHGPVKAFGLPHAKETIAAATKIISRTLRLGSGAMTEPVLLLPADPNRKRLIVNAVGMTANTFPTLTIASDRTGAYNGQFLYVPLFSVVAFSPSPLLDAPEHTGAVWAYTTGIDAAAAPYVVDVTVTAITS